MTAGQAMKCKSCKHRVWFGDYALHYCDVTGKTVEENDECSCGYVPCKIGDTVWAIRNYHSVKMPKEGKVSEMYYVGEEMKLCIVVKNIARGTWGEDIFRTRQEAETRLKEWQKNEKN